MTTAYTEAIIAILDDELAHLSGARGTDRIREAVLADQDIHLLQAASCMGNLEAIDLIVGATSIDEETQRAALGSACSSAQLGAVQVLHKHFAFPDVVLAAECQSAVDALQNLGLVLRVALDLVAPEVVNDSMSTLMLGDRSRVALLIGYLLDDGSRANALSNHERSQLVRSATGNGDVEILDLLSKFGLTDAPGPGDLRNLLHNALSSGFAQNVRELLQRGVSPTAASTVSDALAPNSPGDNPLVVAIRWDFRLGARILREAGARLDATSYDGLPLLHVAARNASIDSVLWLLHEGAPLDARDARGRTAVELAVEEGKLSNLEVARALAAAGAELKKPLPPEETALILAIIRMRPIREDPGPRGDPVLAAIAQSGLLDQPGAYGLPGELLTRHALGRRRRALGPLRERAWRALRALLSKGISAEHWHRTVAEAIEFDSGALIAHLSPHAPPLTQAVLDELMKRAVAIGKTASAAALKDIGASEHVVVAGIVRALHDHDFRQVARLVTIVSTPVDIPSDAVMQALPRRKVTPAADIGLLDCIDVQLFLNRSQDPRALTLIFRKSYDASQLDILRSLRAMISFAPRGDLDDIPLATLDHDERVAALEAALANRQSYIIDLLDEDAIAGVTPELSLTHRRSLVNHLSYRAPILPGSGSRRRVAHLLALARFPEIGSVLLDDPRAMRRAWSAYWRGDTELLVRLLNVGSPTQVHTVVTRDKPELTDDLVRLLIEVPCGAETASHLLKERMVRWFGGEEGQYETPDPELIRDLAACIGEDRPDLIDTHARRVLKFRHMGWKAVSWLLDGSRSAIPMLSEPARLLEIAQWCEERLELANEDSSRRREYEAQTMPFLRALVEFGSPNARSGFAPLLDLPPKWTRESLISSWESFAAREPQAGDAKHAPSVTLQYRTGEISRANHNPWIHESAWYDIRVHWFELSHRRPEWAKRFEHGAFSLPHPQAKSGDWGAALKRTNNEYELNFTMFGGQRRHDDGITGFELRALLHIPDVPVDSTGVALGYPLVEISAGGNLQLFQAWQDDTTEALKPDPLMFDRRRGKVVAGTHKHRFGASRSENKMSLRLRWSQGPAGLAPLPPFSPSARAAAYARIRAYRLLSKANNSKWRADYAAASRALSSGLFAEDYDRYLGRVVDERQAAIKQTGKIHAALVKLLAESATISARLIPELERTMAKVAETQEEEEERSQALELLSAIRELAKTGARTSRLSALIRSDYAMSISVVAESLRLAQLEFAAHHTARGKRQDV